MPSWSLRRSCEPHTRHHELGLSCQALGDHVAAAEALETAVAQATALGDTEAAGAHGESCLIILAVPTNRLGND